MNRKQFIESHGATCSNWTWSWSFVNHTEKFVIFGAWDMHNDGSKAQILSEGWAISRKGRRQPAYAQSREHIRLIEENGYRLMTFPMQHAASDDEDDEGPAKIESFTPELTEKDLLRIGNSWYATDDSFHVGLPEELDAIEVLVEGAAISVPVNVFERNPIARAKCIEHHGYRCAVCSFDFEDFYGPVGRHFIHVHHIVPLSEVRRAHEVDPVKDLIPVCANCHAIIHTTRPALGVDQLRSHLARAQKDT